MKLPPFRIIPAVDRPRIRAILVWAVIPGLLILPFPRTAHATIKPPGAIAQPDVQKIYINQYAYLDGSGSYDPQGYAITTYSWQLMDGNTYTETPASAPDGLFDGETEHQYTYSYVFKVTLTVTNDQEATDTDVQDVTVASWLDGPTNIDSSSVDLSWQNANHSAKFSKYEVHHSTTPGFEPTAQTAAATITAMATTTYEVTGLSAGTAYHFKIKTFFTDDVTVMSNEQAATTVTGKRIVKFFYDARGQMTKISDSRDGGTSFDHLTNLYDRMGRLTKVTYPDSKVLTYAYDAGGNRTMMVDPASNSITYEYDHARLTKVLRGGTADATYAYDDAGRRTKLTLGNNSYTVYEYDDAQNLTKLSNKKSDNSVISSFAYLVDKTGNRTKLTLSNDNVITYGYDNAYQLTRELREDDQSQTLYDIAFHYDDAGNRTKQVHAEGATTTTAYYYDPGNKLTKTTAGAVTTTYTYDGNGSLTKKADGTTTSTYGYNVFGLMNSFDDGTNTATYQFYGAGWARSRSVVSGTTTKLYYDRDNVVAEYDGQGSVQATYVTPGLDQNVSVTRGGSTYQYVHDGLGSVRQVLDSNEATRNSYDYYAFGQTYGSPVENVANPYRFTGRRAEAASGFLYSRHRMYGPEDGSFVSRDPVAGASDYTYGNGNPVAFTDPMGLWASDPGPKRNHILLTAPPAREVCMAQPNKPSDDCIFYIQCTLVHANVSQDTYFSFGGGWLMNQAKAHRHYLRIPDNKILAVVDLGNARKYDEKYGRYIQSEVERFRRELKTGECHKALQALGRVSHSWQDYFAHSVHAYSAYNWYVWMSGYKGNPDSGQRDLWTAWPVAWPLSIRGHKWNREPADEFNRETGIRYDEAMKHTRAKFADFIPKWLKRCRNQCPRP